MICDRCKKTLRSGWNCCPKCGLAVADMAEQSEECHMYTEYRDGVPVAYRYGPEWVAQMLLMEGGYPTPEEAKAAWLRYERSER